MTSRVLWIGIGAVGGVVAYRRGQRAVRVARERGIVGNVAALAGSVSRAAAAIAGPDPRFAEPMPQYVDHTSRPMESIEVLPVRRTAVRRRSSGIPATALRLDAHAADTVVDLRDVRTGTSG